ncbi:histamine H4 receptor-like [Antedon mediterranea]|uniref:histamine H4 receptor-like n=1 Tax=Antedon mediterranea TaxID=105859 RepID=UPI003AF86194
MDLHFEQSDYFLNDTDNTSVYVLSVEDWIAFVGLWLASAFTITGNTLVILSFIRDRKLREKPSNYFLLGLAVMDFITGMVSLPLDNMWRLRDEWPYGPVVCIFWTFLDYTVTVESTYIISLISIDRYFLISKGLHYRDFQTRRRVLFQLFGTLLFSAVFHFVAIVVFEGSEHVDFDKECELNGLGALTYVVLAVILEFIIPMLIVCGFNLVLYIRIRSRLSGSIETPQNASCENKRLNTLAKRIPENLNIGLSTSEESSTLETFDLEASAKPSDIDIRSDKQLNVQPVKKSESPCCQVRPKRSNKQKSSKKAATTLTILIVVFIICWLPYNIVAIIRNVSPELVSIRLWDLVNYLLWLNSAVNPVLYATTNVQFRKNFGELLEKLFQPLTWCA